MKLKLLIRAIKPTLTNLISVSTKGHWGFSLHFYIEHYTCKFNKWYVGTLKQPIEAYIRHLEPMNQT